MKKWLLQQNNLVRKLSLSLTFISLSPVLIFISFYLLFSPDKGKILGAMVSPISFGNQLFAALPESSGTISLEIKTGDARCVLIENYLRKYNSPLLTYAQNLCETAEKYQLDYRLLVAIAQQESNLCKTSHPEWFNCWGWGIHSKGIKTYENFPQAIEDVAKGLKQNYCDKGYCEDPCVMMKKYTPNSNGSWCFGIKKFMAEIESGF